MENQTEVRKHRFNIVDVVAILLLGAVIAAFVIRFSDKKEESRVDLVYVMQTLQGSVDEMIPEELAGNIEPGDAVYDKDTGKRIGTVLTCDSRPAQYTSASKGTTSEVAGYRTLYITCEATAEDEGGKYTVGGVAVSTGRTYTLMFPGLCCKAECISVEEAAKTEP